MPLRFGERSAGPPHHRHRPRQALSVSTGTRCHWSIQQQLQKQPKEGRQSCFTNAIHIVYESSCLKEAAKPDADLALSAAKLHAQRIGQLASFATRV